MIKNGLDNERPKTKSRMHKVHHRLIACHFQTHHLGIQTRNKNLRILKVSKIVLTIIR